MSIHNKSFLRIALTLLFAVIAAALIVCLLPAPQSASAATTEEISIAHISDLHLFIPEYCNSQSGEYMQTYSTDTKLLEESQAAVQAALDKIFEEAPNYVVVSGDLTSNGEKAGHIRLAEMFAALTAQMRSRIDMDRSGFQIYVMPGNHDMYNDRASTYMPTQEELDECADENAKQSLLNNYRRYVPTVSLADFAEIYADFGYGPNTLGDVEYFYDSEYFYDESSGPFDLAVAEKDDIKAWKAANKDYSLLAAKARYGALSYIVRNGNMTFISFDSTLRTFVGKDKHDAIYSYLPQGERPDTMGWEETTGGYINNSMLAWACGAVAPDKAAGKTIVAASHHNFLPHFDMEDEILKDFTLYQWEYISQNLADAGVRYAFSGHQHSNDTTDYLTQSGNVIYDFETGSPISYGAPVRFVSIKRNTQGDTYFEDVKSTLTGINDTLYYTVPKYNPMTGLIEQESKSVSNLLDYLDHKQSELLDTVVSGFVSNSLFGTLKGAVEGLNGVLGMDNSLYNIVIKIINDLSRMDMKKPVFSEDGKTYSFGSATASGYNIIDLAQDMVYWLLKQDVSFGRSEEPIDLYDVVGEVYKSSLSGFNPPVLSKNLQYVKEAADSGELTGLLFDTVFDFLLPQLEILVNAPIRTDIAANPLPAGTGFDIAQQIENGKNNTRMSTLGKTVYNAVIGVIKANLQYDTLFNLLISLPDAVDNILGNDAIAATIANYGAQGAIDTVLSYIDYLVKLKDAGSLTKFFNDEFLSKYFTKSLYVNLGIYVGQVLEAFATDKTPDGAELNGNTGWNVTYLKNVNVAYSASEYGGHAFAKGGAYGDGTISVAPTVLNGMLPSMLTVTFGEDADTEKEFKWFTKIDSSVLDLDAVPGSSLKYWLKDGAPVTLSATSENVQREVPLIDLGIFYLTYELQTYNLHTVKLSNLKPGATYYYQAGSDDYGWSDIYTFTTAGCGSFSVLGITDIQGSVEKNYTDSLNAMKIALEKVKNPAFILSCGDNVDKGSSVSQWEWLLNDLREVFGNYSFVSAAGNHEDGGYALSNAVALPSGDKIKVSETGYYFSFDYGNAHFVVLNTNDLDSEKQLSAEQTAWLTKDLADSAQKWTIVLLHKGPYTAGSHAFDADVIALRAQLTPLFLDGGVDLVLQGHDHTYSVSKAIGRDGKENKDGLVYINMGTMGDKFYNYIYSAEVPLMERSSVSGALAPYFTEDKNLELKETPVFLSLNISDSSINVTTYTVIDGVAYEVDNLQIGGSGLEKDWTILIFSALGLIVLVIVIAIIATLASKKKNGGRKGGKPVSEAVNPTSAPQASSENKPAPYLREERHVSNFAKETAQQRSKEAPKTNVRTRTERPAGFTAASAPKPSNQNVKK